MEKANRRSFLRDCGVAWPGLAGRFGRPDIRVEPAYSRGDHRSGGRGRYLTATFKEIGVEMAAVCDVYEPNLQAGLKEASTSQTLRQLPACPGR